MAKEAYQQGFQFNPKVSTRKGLLEEMYTALDGSRSLLPNVINVPQESLPNKSTVAIPVFDFVPQLLSLLNDPELMVSSKLALNPGKPFDKYVSPNGCYGEANSGSVYGIWFDRLITNPDTDFLCPIILYIDRTHIDEGGRYTLEPLVFTSSIFTIETRCSHKAWRPLGYVSKDYNEVSLLLCDGKTQRDRKKTRTRVKRVNYHRQLQMLLMGIQNAQHRKDIRLKHAKITIDGQPHFKNIFCPILFVIADMSGADDLCLHEKNYGASSSRPHRACDVDFGHLNDANFKCTFQFANVINMITQAGNDEELSNIQQYRVQNAFSSLQVGHPDLGIYGATTLDTMHAFRGGLFAELRASLYKEMPEETREKLDQIARTFVQDNRQSAFADYPRVSVLMTKGMTETASLKNHEYVGLTFLLLCLSQQTETWNILQDELKRGRSNLRTADRATDLVEVLEAMLCFDEWTRQQSL